MKGWPAPAVDAFPAVREAAAGIVPASRGGVDEAVLQRTVAEAVAAALATPEGQRAVVVINMSVQVAAGIGHQQAAPGCSQTTFGGRP